MVSADLSEQIENLPPHDLEAERCVIASMMLDREVIPMVRATVGTDSWFQTDHEIIAGVLFDMQAEGKSVDAVILRAELKRRGLFEEVGGALYLGQILDSVPSTAHVEHYAGIVKECAMWRELIAIGNDAIRIAHGNSRGRFTEPAAEALAALSARAIKAASGGKLSEVHDLQTVALEVVEKLEASASGTGPGQFFKTGLYELDDMVGGLLIGGTTIIAGKPGMGKSAAIKQVLENIARGGIAAGLITIEENRYKVAGNRLSSASGVSNNRIRHAKASAAELVRVRDSVSSLPPSFFIIDVARKTTEIVAAAHLLVAKHRCRVIAIDHLHLVDGDRQRGESREGEVSRISGTLKVLWRELGVAGVEACQLNRASGTERPTIANLRDSGTLEADGDVILLLHREDYYRKKDWKPGDPAPALDDVLEIIVGKNKDGAEGTIKTHFDESTQTVSDLLPADPF